MRNKNGSRSSHGSFVSCSRGTADVNSVCTNCFLLKENPWLAPATIKALREAQTLKVFQKGQTAVCQDTSSHLFYCIASGDIRVRNTDHNGHHSFFLSLKERAMFPMHSLFGDNTCISDFVAEARTVVCAFPLDKFRLLSRSDAGLSYKILEFASQSYRALNYRIQALTQKNAVLNVAVALYCNKNSENICPCSRKDISEWTNLSEETVIRAITLLVKKGLLQRTPKGLAVLDDATYRHYIGR